MGLGGMLMWTAVAGAVRSRYPNKKIALATRPTWRDYLRGRRYHSLVESEIFINNPDFATLEEGRRGKDIIFLYTDEPKNSYHTDCNGERVVFKEGGHAIDIVCRNYGIENPVRRCILCFTEGEVEVAERLYEHFGDFIAVEPYAKGEFTPNKAWAFEKWQTVVNDLARDYTLVQVGVGGKSVLKGVEDVTGHLTFRETAALLSYSLLFLGTEGGLMHAANAVGAKAVIVFSGYTPVALTGYDNQIELMADISCAPCGLRIPCPIDLKCMEMITPDLVIAAARRMLDTAFSDQSSAE